MRGVVHGCGDALRKHPRLRHVMDALDLDVFEIRPVRRLIAETMGQIVKGKSHRVVLVLLERDAANLLRHLKPPRSLWPRPLQRGVAAICTRIWYICTG